MIKFSGFLPDIDPVTPGAILDCTNIIPTIKAFKAAPSAIDGGLTAVSAAANSLVVVEKLDGTRRAFAGTATTLEEAGSGVWTDRSGAVYSAAVDARWSFAQFGNYTLAANSGDTLQVSTTASFADVTGAPKATHIAVSDGFVMAVNMAASANPNHQSDGWHCSAYNDYSDWAESVSTQCTSGRLIGGGRITGVKKFGNGFVAWKNNSTYLATYVGAPVVFQWNEVPGDVGCPTGHAAVDIGDRVAFLGHDDFYIFDGANNHSIGEGIREWFFDNAENNFAFRTIATYNPITSNVTWYFVSTSAGNSTPDKAVVYNVRSGKWGKFSISVEAAANYYTDGITFDSLGSLYTTFDDLPTDISYDSPYWLAATITSGVIKTDHKLYTLTGTPTSSSLTMNVFGDDELFSTIQRVRPRFLTEPESSTIDYSYDNTYGDSFTDKGTYSLSNGKYDLLYSARWHKVKYNFVGNMEIIGTTVTVIPDGTQ